jgi:hypothetical protein
MATLDQIIVRGDLELELVLIQDMEEKDQPLWQEMHLRQQERNRRKKQVQTELQHLQETVKLQDKAESGVEADMTLVRQQSIADVSGVDSGDHANLSKDTLLKQIAEVAEGTALRALNGLLAGRWAWAECMGADVYREAWIARVALAQSPSSSPRSHTLSAEALLAMGRGVAMCLPGSQLAMRVAEVENTVRDVAVWRCQLTVPFGNRNKLKAALAEAFGDKLEDTNLSSRLMHTHRHVITEHLKKTGHPTFLSNTQQAGMKRGRIRPKRFRRCDYEENPDSPHATSTKAPDAEDEAEERASPAAQDVAASATSDSRNESPTSAAAPNPTAAAPEAAMRQEAAANEAPRQLPETRADEGERRASPATLEVAASATSDGGSEAPTSAAAPNPAAAALEAAMRPKAEADEAPRQLPETRADDGEGRASPATLEVAASATSDGRTEAPTSAAAPNPAAAAS